MRDVAPEAAGLFCTLRRRKLMAVALRLDWTTEQLDRLRARAWGHWLQYSDSIRRMFQAELAAMDSKDIVARGRGRQTIVVEPDAILPPGAPRTPPGGFSFMFAVYGGRFGPSRAGGEAWLARKTPQDIDLAIAQAFETGDRYQTRCSACPCSPAVRWCSCAATHARTAAAASPTATTARLTRWSSPGRKTPSSSGTPAASVSLHRRRNCEIDQRQECGPTELCSRLSVARQRVRAQASGRSCCRQKILRVAGWCVATAITAD